MNGRLAGRRVGKFVDAVLVIVGGEEYDVDNPVIGDEFQQRVAFRAIAAHPRLATVVGHGRVSARRAAQGERRAARNRRGCCRKTIGDREGRAIGIDRSDLGAVGNVDAGNRLTGNKANGAGHGEGLATRIRRRRDRSNGAQGAVFSGGRRIVQRQAAADRPDLVDRIGNVDELPGGTAVLPREKRLLQPRQLRGTEHRAVWVVGASAGVVGIIGSLDADVAIGATIGIDEDGIPAPPLSEVELTGAVRARVRRRIDQSAFFHRLVVLENLLQRLQAAALVYKRHAAVVRRDVVRTDSRIHTCAGGEIEGRADGRAADGAASRRAAVDVLFVAQFVIVIGRVVALAREKGLKAVLPAGVHRQKLLAIFAREVAKQLRLRGCRVRRRWIRNVPRAVDSR